MTTVKPRWREYMDILAASNDPLGPSEIASRHPEHSAAGRADAAVRSAMQALERRGLVKRSSWLSPRERWSLTLEGREYLKGATE
jgi:repressor of nif and glnA expression